MSRIIALLMLALAVSVSASAQTVTGTLSGTVTDAAGAVVPNIEVTAVSKETSITRQIKTNGEGFFLMSFLPLGTYDVTVAAPGFSKVVKTDVVIELNKTTVSNFKLEVSSVGIAVEIRGETPQIETTTGEIKHSLDERRVEDTPLAGRNFISLVEQIPGFQISSFGGDASSGQNNPTNSSGSFIVANAIPRAASSSATPLARGTIGNTTSDSPKRTSSPIVRSASSVIASATAPLCRM